MLQRNVTKMFIGFESVTLHASCTAFWVQLMLPRVVIVGGGFGGLAAVRALRKAPVRVTLIDKRNYHLFRPMLYQVATGLLSADEISGPYVLSSAIRKTLTFSWMKSQASTPADASSI